MRFLLDKLKFVIIIQSIIQYFVLHTQLILFDENRTHIMRFEVKFDFQM